jgi:hypothetical protein
MSSSSQIKWDCPNCQITVTDRHKYCNNCQTMLVWTCVASEKSSLYKNYHELEEEREQRKEEKNVSKIQELQALYDGE